MAVRYERITENKLLDQPLGRHIEHDDASWNYRFIPKATTLKSVTHDRTIPILDQGNLGSCTGNAGTGAMGTAPNNNALVIKDIQAQLNEDYAVALYSAATKLDSAPGSYPPDDTGSSGLAIAKVLKSRGLISAYQHTFTASDALLALQEHPLLIGSNWRSDMDDPDSSGKVSYSGEIRGGHEYVAYAYDADKDVVYFDNSWGQSWGVDGTFNMTGKDFAKMLSEDGDVIVLQPFLDVPDPTPTPPVPPEPAPVPVPTPVSDTQFMSDWLANKPFFYKAFQRKLTAWLAHREDEMTSLQSYLDYEQGSDGDKG